MFKSYLNTLKRKYRKFDLFYDGAPQHTSQSVERYLRRHKRTIVPIRFPACSLELNPVEECWNHGKWNILGSTLPETFKKMREGCQNTTE